MVFALSVSKILKKAIAETIHPESFSDSLKIAKTLKLFSCSV